MKIKTCLISLIILGNINPTLATSSSDLPCKTSDYIPTEKLSLNKIIEIGLCRNPTTTAAYHSVEAARADKNASYSGYMPEIDLSLSYGMNRQNRHDANYPEETDYTTSGSASISANYLLFDFGKREANIDKMTALWKAVDFDRNNMIQEYVFNLISAYYNVLMTTSNEKVAKKLLDVATESKEMSQTKFNAGVVAKIDVLRAETTRASRELDYQKAVNETLKAKGQLLYLLDYSQNQEILLEDPLDTSTLFSEKQSVDLLIKQALQNRQDLKSAEAKLEANKAIWDASARSRLPSISAYGSYSLNDTSREYKTHGNTGTIGLKASMPLFSGLSLLYNQRSAKQNYLASEENLKQVQNQIEYDVWTSYQNYQTSIETMSTTKTLLTSATESERSTREMYKVGKATMLDWLITQSDFADAEYQSVYAKYDYFIKKASLALAIGDLTGK